MGREGGGGGVGGAVCWISAVMPQGRREGPRCPGSVAEGGSRKRKVGKVEILGATAEGRRARALSTPDLK